MVGNHDIHTSMYQSSERNRTPQFCRHTQHPHACTGMAAVTLSTGEAQMAPSQPSPAANGSAPQAANGAALGAVGASADAGSDAAKRLRNLQKKLRQVNADSAFRPVRDELTSHICCGDRQIHLLSGNCISIKLPRLSHMTLHTGPEDEPSRALYISNA